MIKNIKWLLFVSLTIAACSSNEEDTSGVVPQVPITKGSADFSRYVSLGNSITSGYADGALFIAGQANSYPKLLADQFSFAGGGNFKIPYMNDNVGGFIFAGGPFPSSGFGPRLIFDYITRSPIPLPNATPTTDITSPPLTGPFNNLGVPGAKSFHLLTPGYGNINGLLTSPPTANPYFVRFASSPTTTVLADAMAQNPTFFTLWIGNNDVLFYAISGGTGTNQTGNSNPNTYGMYDITDPNVFASSYSSLINGLTLNGAKGVVANIPYVSSLPFFTTVPYNPVSLDIATASQLNGVSGYGAYNSGIVQAFTYLVTNNMMSQANANAEIAKRTITFHEGSGNAVVIMDEYLTDLTSINPALVSMRQATKEDLIVLTASSFIGSTVGGNPLYINGVSVPLADKWVLSKNEIAEVKTATDAYNQTIKSIANSKGLAFVDANDSLNQVANGGVNFDNYNMTSSFVQGGAFGLDGVHPSARGQAYIANKFIEAINATYGSTIRTYKPQVFPLSYPVGL